MKNMKKLTAFVASILLAVGAIPANIYAEGVVGDWDGDGVICTEDCNAYLEHIINVENGTVGYLDAATGEYFRTEELLKWVNENHDITGDGVVDKRDFIIVSQLSVTPATENTKIGDVNHDGYITKIDGYMIKYYLEDVAEGNENFYTEEQIANFNAYGDIDGDGDVDETDAELIITRGYIKPVSQPVANVSLDEYINSDSDSGDVNHDGFVDARDATMISCFYADLATDNYDHYTEEEFENFFTYGDVNEDGYVNSIDASYILTKYAESSTQ